LKSIAEVKTAAVQNSVNRTSEILEKKLPEVLKAMGIGPREETPPESKPEDGKANTDPRLSKLLTELAEERKANAQFRTELKQREEREIATRKENALRAAITAAGLTRGAEYLLDSTLRRGKISVDGENVLVAEGDETRTAADHFKAFAAKPEADIFKPAVSPNGLPKSAGAGATTTTGGIVIDLANPDIGRLVSDEAYQNAFAAASLKQSVVVTGG
jgi:hypothetical protein